MALEVTPNWFKPLTGPDERCDVLSLHAMEMLQLEDGGCTLNAGTLPWGHVQLLLESMGVSPLTALELEQTLSGLLQHPVKSMGGLSMTLTTAASDSQSAPDANAL